MHSRIYTQYGDMFFCKSEQAGSWVNTQGMANIIH